MALEELKHGDDDAIPQLEAARARFEGMRAELDVEMQQKFAEWDTAHDRAVLTELRALLNRRKYITNLITQTNVPDRV